SRAEAAWRTLTSLRFFWNSPKGPQPDATGYKGFYYHFLDMQTGRRVWQCELSTLDTALLLAGVLAVSVYFDQDTEEERDIRSVAEALYRREDRKSTRLNSSHGSISYAVFCLKKKTKIKNTANIQYITQIVLLF